MDGKIYVIGVIANFLLHSGGGPQETKTCILDILLSNFDTSTRIMIRKTLKMRTYLSILCIFYFTEQRLKGGCNSRGKEQ